jgi:hypothetical protein
MPRVKMVYQEHGEWAPASAQPGTCKHPRDRLRYDSNFAMPIHMYCRDCGTRYLSPYHGMTQEEMDEVRERAKQRAIEYGFMDENGNWLDDDD